MVSKRDFITVFNELLNLVFSFDVILLIINEIDLYKITVLG
jgi:hypothetical protein